MPVRHYGEGDIQHSLSSRINDTLAKLSVRFTSRRVFFWYKEDRKSTLLRQMFLKFSYRSFCCQTFCTLSAWSSRIRRLPSGSWEKTRGRARRKAVKTSSSLARIMPKIGGGKYSHRGFYCRGSEIPSYAIHGSCLGGNIGQKL